MDLSSRTNKGIVNSSISLFFVALQFILGFYSRKIFLEYLGTEILGLNTTAVNILQFLNLAELGVGAAVAFSLYKPLHHKDKDGICEIISLQGFLYKRIATGILMFSVVVMAFFPLIFKKIDLPMWYTYASFGVLLYSSLIGYYFNYRQIILSAAQLDYKNQLYTRPLLLLKIILQIVAMQMFEHPYEWWLFLEFVFSTLSAISLHYITKKEFPYLKTISNYKELKKKYNTILVKIKQLFFHKIAGFALNQASPLIIYGYLTLSAVALYGNYLIIVNGIKVICNAVYSSLGGGVGDLVAEGDKGKIESVFFELFSVRFLMATTFSLCFVTLTNSLITVWIGEEYIFPRLTVFLMGAVLFIDIERNTVDMFLSAYGLFRDVWAPIVEAIINLGLAILLGYFYKLNGIIGGVLISLCLIVMCWKPFFLFRNGMQISIFRYIKSFLSHLALFILIGTPFYIISESISQQYVAGWLSFFVYSGIFIIAFVAMYGGALILFNLGIKKFIKRLYSKFSLSNGEK